MDNSSNQMDPWANMGNLSTSNLGETSPESAARAAEWSEAMEDAPEFNGEQKEEAPDRDQNIAEASAILNYGLNAASRETSVEQVIQTISNFIPKADEDPIDQLMIELGIDTKEEVEDLEDESKASKLNEEKYRQDVNAPATIKRSREGALIAIREVKDLVNEVKTSPAYAGLRAEALSSNKGLFEYAVSKFGVRDLTVLFSALAEEKRKYESEQNKKPEESLENKSEEDQEEQLGLAA